MGVAFEVRTATLGGQPLFPHILTKNTSFEVNFGERMEGAFFPNPPRLGDFEFAADVPMALRKRGTPQPEKREDCEVRAS